MGEKHDHDLLGEANGWEDDGSLEDVEETSEQPQPAQMQDQNQEQDFTEEWNDCNQSKSANNQDPADTFEEDERHDEPEANSFSSPRGKNEMEEIVARRDDTPIPD